MERASVGHRKLLDLCFFASTLEAAIRGGKFVSGLCMCVEGLEPRAEWTIYFCGSRSKLPIARIEMP
jgi:hypothetical protein